MKIRRNNASTDLKCSGRSARRIVRQSLTLFPVQNLPTAPILHFIMRVLRLLPVAVVLLPTHHVVADEQSLTFEKDVRPVFRAHCYDCHGATEEVEGGLDLRLVRFMLKGGDSGAVIVPGVPSDSLLLKRIRNGEMPPGEHTAKSKTPRSIKS